MFVIRVLRTRGTEIYEKKKKKEVNAEFFSPLKNKTRRLWLDRASTAEGMNPRGQKR